MIHAKKEAMVWFVLMCMQDAYRIESHAHSMIKC